MTLIPEPVARRRELCASVFGCLVTACFALWSQILFPPAAAVTDPRMESACRWPTLEGEFTAVTVLNGKVVCWVMK